MAWTPVVEQWRPMVVERLQALSGRHKSLCSSVILSLIHNESGGRSEAIGADNEVGLMQILPTADRPSPAEMLDPETNIKLGVDYLNRQTKRFGDLFTGLIAYKTGPGNIGAASDRLKERVQGIINHALADMDPSIHSLLPPGEPIDPITRARVTGGSSPCVTGQRLVVAGNGNGDATSKPWWLLALLSAAAGYSILK